MMTYDQLANKFRAMQLHTLQELYLPEEATPRMLSKVMRVVLSSLTQAKAKLRCNKLTQADKEHFASIKQYSFALLAEIANILPGVIAEAISDGTDVFALLQIYESCAEAAEALFQEQLADEAEAVANGESMPILSMAQLEALKRALN